MSVRREEAVMKRRERERERERERFDTRKINEVLGKKDFETNLIPSSPPKFSLIGRCAN